MVVATLWLATTATAGAAVPSCVWKVYDGARGAPQTIFTDADATPPFAIRFEGDFHTGGLTLSENGGIDFDGDGRTDPFRVVPHAGGFAQWQSVSGGSPAGWQNMAYASGTLSTFHFGDFDADGKSDVFASYISVSPNTQWVYSSGGNTNYQNLNGATVFIPLDFGRFDGDAKTDVFGLVPTGTSSQYDFDYSSGGLAMFAKLSTNFVSNTSQLRFGDFNGDGKTDVFEAFDSGNGTSFWVYFPGGTSPSVTLNTQPFQIGDLQFGDFDNDGKTDPFATRALPDGRLEWVYWAGGVGDPIVLNTVDGPVPRLGEFAGDGRTDALIIQCGAEPVVTPLPPLNVTKVPKTIFRYAVGDVNGDGNPDIIRSSVCQNYNSDIGFCGPSINFVEILVGDGHGGFSAPTPNQQLFSSVSLDDANQLWADVTGDGLTDLIWMVFAGATGIDVYVAVANGDGSFTERPKQTLTVPNGLSSSLIDVNGDGRTDLIWTSVCQNRQGFDFTGCSVGSDNRVIVAFAAPDGSFAVSGLQSLSPSGWMSFRANEGDVNGDGNLDVIFNSTCQRNDIFDSTCTAGAANLVSVALGDGKGGFTLGPRQTYEPSGWDTFGFTGVLDLNGDGRDDLVWIASCDEPASFCEVGSSLALRAGLSNGDGTFTVTPRQDVGFGYWTSFRMNRGDVDGDGKSDVILYVIGPDLRDSAEVYVLFSDGSGGLTPSPMQVLNGRGWYPSNSGFTVLSVADVNRDGKVELNWFDTAPADHDRVIVSGNVPAITATTTTTTIVTGTTVTTVTTIASTTTTTIQTPPPPRDCAAEAGLGGAQCFCAAALAPAACAGATLPTKITAKFGKACTILETAAAASPKKQKKLLGKMAGRLGGLVRLSSKKATTKNLPPGCGTALRGQLSAMKTDVVAARKSVGH